jgi:hypothetical protein
LAKRHKGKARLFGKMSLLTLIFSATVFAQPQLAFTARFYSSSEKKTRHQLYVSNLNGSERKLLGTPQEPFAVQWLGKDQLVFKTDAGLFYSKLSPWKPVRIPNTAGVNFLYSRSRFDKPGNPTFIDEQELVIRLGFENGRRIPSEAGTYPGEIDLSESLIHVQIPGSKAALDLVKNQDFDFVGKDPESAHAFFGVERAWKSPSALWVLTGEHDSTSGYRCALLKFEGVEKPSLLFDNANNFDVFPGRDTIAFTTARVTTKLGENEVWVSELKVGSLSSLTSRSILKGKVWVSSVSIRP